MVTLQLNFDEYLTENYVTCLKRETCLYDLSLLFAMLCFYQVVKLLHV